MANDTVSLQYNYSKLSMPASQASTLSIPSAPHPDLLSVPPYNHRHA